MGVLNRAPWRKFFKKLLIKKIDSKSTQNGVKFEMLTTFDKNIPNPPHEFSTRVRLSESQLTSCEGVKKINQQRVVFSLREKQFFEGYNEENKVE